MVNGALHITPLLPAPARRQTLQPPPARCSGCPV